MLQPIVKQKFDDSNQPQLTLTELLDQYSAFAYRVRDLADETVKVQQLYINRFFTLQNISSATEFFGLLCPNYIQQCLFDYPEKYGPTSRRMMHSSLRSFLKFCRHQGYTSCDWSSTVPSFRNCPVKPLPNPIEEDTIRRLLDSIDRTSPIGLRNFAIIQMLTTYGVRGVHIRVLKLTDINWQQNTLVFQVCKRGKPIVQHLTTQMGNCLLAYIRDGRPNHTPYPEVFLTARPPHQPFTKATSLSSVVDRCLQNAAIELPKGVSRGTHSFRHAFATRLVGKIPLKHIADMLGHSDMSSSILYTRIDGNSLKKAALPWPEEVK